MKEDMVVPCLRLPTPFRFPGRFPVREFFVSAKSSDLIVLVTELIGFLESFAKESTDMFPVPKVAEPWNLSGALTVAAGAAPEEEKVVSMAEVGEGPEPTFESFDVTRVGSDREGGRDCASSSEFSS
jgi:hypothetical protein